MSIYNAGDLGSSPGLGRSPGEGNGNPLQYCCLENPMDRGAWYTTVYGVTKSRTRLSDLTNFTLLVPVGPAGPASYASEQQGNWRFNRRFTEKAMAPHSGTLAWKIHG